MTGSVSKARPFRAATEFSSSVIYCSQHLSKPTVPIEALTLAALRDWDCPRHGWYCRSGRDSSTHVSDDVLTPPGGYGSHVR
jgi:hypothetical protein